jgi:hypothetical protein
VLLSTITYRPSPLNGKALCSGAGYYIGTTCWTPDFGGFVDMGSRESGYFPSAEEAGKALESGDFDERRCVENDFAYSQGLPRTNGRRP